MRSLPLLVLLASFAGPSLAATESPKLTGKTLAERKGCYGCHEKEHKDKAVVPSFADIAARYKSDPSAPPMLAKKIRSGGKGHWGNEVAMMPQPYVSVAEAKELARWVLDR